MSNSDAENVKFRSSECQILLFLFQRIRHYMDWSVNSIQFLALKEVHGTFLECFLNTAANFAKKSDGKLVQFYTIRPS
jgi:hypothetical protein